MVSQKVTFKESLGLHARPAMKIVQKCQRFESEITICNGCEKASGCSILELMLLGVSKGTELEVVATGKDEKEAVKELVELFEEGAGI